MRIYTLLWVLIWSPLLANGQFSPDSAEYAWPTDGSRYLSGTFAETRSQHFHSALDIKTWGRKGYEVYATRSGVLHRIAIGPGGYGKVVYLKHPDRSYSVYAHLLTFEETIQQIADTIRFRNYDHEIDVVVDSLNIQIEQGQVIGYSGATGVGPPHLHFELRTPSEKPFNPLLTNLSVPDNIPPQFSRLSVEPLSPETRIEGQNRIYLKSALSRTGYYDFGTIDIQGPVGLGVDVFDQANRVSNAYAVYDLKLYMEDKLLFHSRVDSFSYDETSQMYLDRVYPILKRTGSGYQRLHVVDGNTLPFYRETKNRGRLNLSEGIHDLRIVAEDYFGNRSEARLTLDVTERDGYAVSSPFSSNGSQDKNREWRWHGDWIDFNSADPADYLVTSIDTSVHAALPLKMDAKSYLALNEFDFISIQQSNGELMHLYRVLPEKRSRVHGSGINAYAEFPEHAFYDTLTVAMTGTVFNPDSVRLDIQPANQPIRKDFELTCILTPEQRDDTTLALYSYNRRRNKLSYVPSRVGGPVLKGMAEELGTYFVLKDTLAPTIYRPRIYRREDGKWIASVKVDDNRSGINPAKTEFYINDIRGIAEFEPEDDRILYYHPDFTPLEVMNLHIKVEDMVGNITEREFRLD